MPFSVDGNKSLTELVLAGPPNSSIIRSLSLDLERRGFIVYIVCANMDEEQQVLSESRTDVRPLHLDVVDTFGTEEAIDRFNAVLRRPHVAFAGASPHKRMCCLFPPPTFLQGSFKHIPDCSESHEKTL